MRVAVVSPHLDDAVLSVGGTISALSRRGAHVTIITVFAGDPLSEMPASYWDATRGQPTQGAAVRLRRLEDERAVAELSASGVALPWPDSGYPGRRDPDAIWQQLHPILEGADITLLPGWPLSHGDHRYTTMLVMERLDRTAPVAFYAEQPYAAEPMTMLKGAIRNRTVAPLRHACGGTIRWHRYRLDATARRAQDRAVSHYGGELANLGLRGRWGRLVRRLTGGEWLGVGEQTMLPSEFGLP
jgi:LmbE family N-acetylglucosaminyl deacetylase